MATAPSGAASPDAYLLEHLGVYYEVPVHKGDDPPPVTSVVATMRTPLALADGEKIARHLDPDSYVGGAKIEPQHVVLVESPRRAHTYSDGKLDCYLVDQRWMAVLVVAGAAGAATDDARVLRALPSSIVRKMKQLMALPAHEPAAERRAPRSAMRRAHERRLMLKFARVVPDGDTISYECRANELMSCGGDGSMSKEMQPYAGSKPIVSAADGPLAALRATPVDATPPWFMQKPLPSAQLLIDALHRNAWLAASVRRVAVHAFDGFGATDLITSDLSGCGDERLCFEHEWTQRERLSIVRFLSRLGLSGIVRPYDEDYPISVSFPGHATTLSWHIKRRDARLRGWGVAGDDEVKFYGRSFKQVRMRGVLRCVPRLLGWLRAARIALDDPTKHPEKLAAWAAEGDALLASGENTLAKPAADEQAARKRAWKDALWCDAEDTKDGARWASIRLLGEERAYKHARVEALAGPDHLVVQVERTIDPSHPAAGATLAAYDVRVLRDDEYEISWIRHAEGVNSNTLEDDFRKRFVQGLYGFPGHMIRTHLDEFDSDDDDQ